MSGKIRDLLKKAADAERRTVASLLDKIIIEYLQQSGYLPRQEFKQDKRRVARKKTMLPAMAMQDTADETESYPCLLLDISTGGVLLGFSKGSDLMIFSRGGLPRFRLAFTIPDIQRPVRFDCAARHMRDMGDAIQMGCMFESNSNNEKQALHNYLLSLSEVSLYPQNS